MVIVNRLIVDAIHARRRLSFTYNGTPRVVEPQCYGLGRKGTELLRAHQIQGGPALEPLFDVSKMANVAALSDHFAQPGPNYKENDSAMTTIFAQL